jgi:hypothetical protein
MPGYIIGYIFTDWFDFAGPIQYGYEMSLAGKQGTTGFLIFAPLEVLQLSCR